MKIRNDEHFADRDILLRVLEGKKSKFHRWTFEETKEFIQAVKTYGKDYKMI